MLDTYLPIGKIGFVERGKPRTDTRERLLEVAGDLVQQRGYNAVSYRDLAAAVEIKTASIHYYFPAKADLVQELMRRYRAGFDAARGEIDRDVLGVVGGVDRGTRGSRSSSRSSCSSSTAAGR